MKRINNENLDEVSEEMIKHLGNKSLILYDENDKKYYLLNPYHLEDIRRDNGYFNISFSNDFAFESIRCKLDGSEYYETHNKKIELKTDEKHISVYFNNF